MVSALFEGLTRNDPRSGAPIPGLADGWDVSKDGRVYTFHLRSNAVWSTGEPITAEDVVYSWLRVLDPATAGDYAGQLFYLENAEDFNRGKLKDPSRVGVRARGPQGTKEFSLILRIDTPDTVGFLYELTNALALHRVYIARVEISGEKR